MRHVLITCYILHHPLNEGIKKGPVDRLHVNGHKLREQRKGFESCVIVSLLSHSN